jgi:stalled ribosome rescue protein Dom34
VDVREALVRLAGQLECPVEVVEESEALMSLGGVGCLLRYRQESPKQKPDLLVQV